MTEYVQLLNRLVTGIAKRTSVLELKWKTDDEIMHDNFFDIEGSVEIPELQKPKPPVP